MRLLLQDHVEKVDAGTQISLATKAIYSDFEPNNTAYEDLKENIKAMDQNQLSAEMKSRLLNESLEYLGANTRQIELYALILKEIGSLEGLLQFKCQIHKY